VHNLPIDGSSQGGLRRRKEWKTRSMQLARDPEAEKLKFLI
jgi:hypothetical protein